MLGPLGFLLILVSFVATGVATWLYFGAARQERLRDVAVKRARTAWNVSFATLGAASAVLLYLIFTRQFQYNYVYSYTALDLNVFYTFAAFWAGQEGSFLFWILCVGATGLVLIRKAGSFEAPVMALVGLCQLFLVSMVLGLDLGAFKLGISPFMTLAERYPTEAALQQPGYVPADGAGLNDLLQNPWMVIHPPVLFVGFALMLVPFAYAVAGLWQKRYTEWVKPALPWALFANLALMAGIALGGYWAYITLSFGGYWAWDPVENSSLVPWLISVAALHTMISQKISGTSHKASFLLNILAFVLVVYSTFLTRSGVLGDTSVHSFTDLGLYNQLLLWILTLGGIGLALFVKRYRALPVPKHEMNILSREFMIFSGAMILCALGAVILLGTSTPILGSLFRDNPSTVDISFYNKWSLPLAVLMALVAGMGPLFWWKKMTREQVGDVLFRPMVFSTVSTVVILLFTPFVEKVVEPTLMAAAGGAAAGQLMASGVGGALGHYWSSFGVGLLLLLLVFASFFALYGNGIVLWRIGRGNPRMAGGAVSHIGLVLMLFGIVTSSVFNNPLGDQKSGNREVFVLDEGVPTTVEGYQVTFTGHEPNEQGRTAYHLSFTDPAGRSFEVSPVTYITRRGQWFQSPDTKHFLEKDVYVAVSPSAMFDKNGTAGQTGQLDLMRGDSADVGGAFRVRFDAFDLKAESPAVPDSAGIVVAAVLDVTNLQTGERRTLRPIYYMGASHTVGYVPARADDWNLGLTLTGMQVDGGAVRLQVEGVEVAAREWLVVQAYEKPFINLLWTGLIVMLVGFSLATFRRIGEESLHEDRAQRHQQPA